MSAVSRASSSRPCGILGSCDASSDAGRAPHRHGASKSTAVVEHARRRRGDARGSVVSPGRLLQDQLVEGQVRHRAAQPGVLGFKLLQAFYLVALQPTELLTPAVIRNLADTNRTDRLGHPLTLRGQNINLPQLGNDLLRLVGLPWHCGPPCQQKHSSGWTTSAGVDQIRRVGVEDPAAGIGSLLAVARAIHAVSLGRLPFRRGWCSPCLSTNSMSLISNRSNADRIGARYLARL